MYKVYILTYHVWTRPWHRAVEELPLDEYISKTEFLSVVASVECKQNKAA